MIKIGAKVLDKAGKHEWELIGIRTDEDDTEICTFSRKESGNTHFKYISTDRLEKELFFLVEHHPSVRDKDRKKSRKTREKVSQPTEDCEPSALSLLA